MVIPRIHRNRLWAVRTAILKAPRYPPSEWAWIGEEGLKYLTRKRANKFLFACILDYQIDADAVWDRFREFVEVELNDPDDLWNVVAANRLSSWLQRTRDFEYEG